MTSLEAAARAVVDATGQTLSGQWIIHGDGEELMAALASALEPAPRHAPAPDELVWVVLPSAGHSPVNVNAMTLDQAREALQVLGADLHRAWRLLRFVPGGKS